MKRSIGTMAVAIVLSFFLLSALPGIANGNIYTENFTTTLYEDPAHTTANWDTVNGELCLFPFQPTLIGSYNTPGYAKGVIVSGDYAFVADNDYGLQVIDISDPTNPTLLGTYDTPNYAWGVAVSGDYAFVADYSTGLCVIDISDPTSPALLGTYNTPGGAVGVTVSGDYAFVADGASGLCVIDISDPTSPALLGSYDTPGYARCVTVSGDYAFVADAQSGLCVIDISDPANPTLLGTYDTPSDARGVTVSGDYALVADNTFGLYVIDITDPTDPTLLGTCDTPGYAFGVTVSGDYAFVADYGSGICVIDITDPTDPTLLGSYDTIGYSWGVMVSGDNAFVADGNYGLQVIKIADLVNPTLIGNYNTSSYAWGVAVSGDYAYVADYVSGLHVIDIEDPMNPTLLGTYDTPDYAYGVAVSGDYAYVADGASGLQIIDITDPASPALLGSYNTLGFAYGVAVSGDYAFVADGGSGKLYVIDISDPASPTLLGNYDYYGMGHIWDVVVSGDCAFLACGDMGLRLIDITDPTNLTFLGAYNTPGTARGVTVSGDCAFVADDDYGLQVVDISDPTYPQLLGNYDTPGSAYGVTVSGDYAFVADAASGLYVINITDPTNPTLFGIYNTPSSAYDVIVSGDNAFVADYVSGLQVINVFRGGLNVDDNVGRSLFVDASSDSIFRACLTTTQIDSLHWELSADAGVNWQGILPGSGWNKMNVPGTDLLWRSTLTWEEVGDDPAVTELQIEWLVAAALIENIADVPNDQGGWVQMQFMRSGRDFLDETALRIEKYGIWRRVDNSVLVTALNSALLYPAVKSAVADTPELNGIPFITYEGGTYIQSGPGFAATTFPPGTWVRVASINASQQDTYIATVPTEIDSSASGTNHAVFVIAAYTPNSAIWYVSEPDSGYSIDNIAPAVPTNFAVAYNTGSGNYLSWDTCPDADFKQFNIYRSNDPKFTPLFSDLVHSETGTNWSDPEYDGWDVYYKITALDSAGNESGPASPGTVTGAEDLSIPQTYRLYPNVPNPFNPTTSIRYDVPAGGGAVTFRIYDVSGRLIQTVLDGPQTVGQKTVTWNGRDSRGQNVASGVYFYRLKAPGYEKTLRMVLLR